MLIFCIFLNFLPFVLSEFSTSYACINSQATINFKPYKDMNSSIKYTKINNSEKEFVASSLKGQLTSNQQYDEGISMDENGNLKIGKVLEKHEGLYNREIRNGGTFEETVVLKVLKPPSGPPFINKQIDKAGNVIVSCLSPNELGKPKAYVVLQDSVGRSQSRHKHTIDDDMYACCLEGESVTKCYSNQLDKCVSLKLPKTRDIKCNSTKGCKETELCVCISIVSFVIFYSLFLACIFFSAEGKTWKQRLYDIGYNRLAASPAISIFILTCLCGYVCSTEGCGNYVRNVITGTVSSFFGLFPFIKSIVHRDRDNFRSKYYINAAEKQTINEDNIGEREDLMAATANQRGESGEDKDDSGRTNSVSRNSSIRRTDSNSSKTSNKSGTANDFEPVYNQLIESQNTA